MVPKINFYGAGKRSLAYYIFFNIYMCDKTKMRILPILRTTLLAILTLTFKCSVDLSMIIFNQMPINFTCFLTKNQKLALCITNKSITREDWWTPESYNYQNINLQSKKKPSKEIVWELLSFTAKLYTNIFQAC